MLQCRNRKRTAKAAVKIAVDMVKEGTLTEEEALLRIPAKRTIWTFSYTPLSTPARRRYAAQPHIRTPSDAMRSWFSCDVITVHFGSIGFALLGATLRCVAVRCLALRREMWCDVICLTRFDGMIHDPNTDS